MRETGKIRMGKVSAGLLVYRKSSTDLEVLLVHPGGPFWAKKDEGAWSIPKGEIEEGEEPLQVAIREFQEETGKTIAGKLQSMEPLRQPGGKLVYAWAIEGDFDPSEFRSNTFDLEWPPKSGRRQEFPEVDRAAWFPIEAAMIKILHGQQGFITQLLALLNLDHIR